MKCFSFFVFSNYKAIVIAPLNSRLTNEKHDSSVFCIQSQVYIA